MTLARAVAFKIADISRAIKGATKAGMAIGRAEIDPSTGKIVLIPAGEKPTPQDDLDRWLEKRNASAPS
jgi:hypothetical protein